MNGAGSSPSPLRRFLGDLQDAFARLARGGVSLGGGRMTVDLLPRNATPLTAANDTSWPDSFHWWIDSVGSYLVFTKPRIRIGQAGSKENDVAILGDLSSHHADLVVSASGILLVPQAPTTVNGKPGDSFLLRDKDHIRMRGVELVYHRPSPWGMTSRLEIVSRHRLPMSMDGIILLGETCTIGPRPEAVIQTEWESAIYLNWYQGRYWVRGPEDLRVDGKATDGCAPLEPNSQIRGNWGSFRWEPIQPR